MSEATYNDQTMTEYLLGSLPAPDAERYDELSVADDQFAAALNVCEKDLLDSYLQGELDGPILERFKAHYLASPLRREKVAFAVAWQVFAKRSVVDVRTDEADGATKRTWFVALSSLFRTGHLLQRGLAFGLLILLAAGGWFAIDNLRLRREISQARIRRDELQHLEEGLQKQLEARHEANSKVEQELARVRAERERLDQELKKQTPPQSNSPADQTIIARLILTPGRRGAGQVQTLSLPPGPGRVALELGLEPGEFVSYTVALIDQSNHQTLWQSGRLRAHSGASGKGITVSFSSALLKPQIYLLQVSGVSANGTTEVMSDYPFKVVK